MSNLFKLDFSGGLISAGSLSDMPISLMVRAGDFTPPVFNASTMNKVNFLTTSVDFPLASISGTKELSVKFRVDENYDVYAWLLHQQSQTSNGNLGYASGRVPDSNAEGFKVAVYAYDRSLAAVESDSADPDASSSYRKMYEYRHCWVKSIGDLSYSYDSPKAETVTVTIGFFEFDDPMHLLFQD